jgi:hypothetical protein
MIACACKLAKRQYHVCKKANKVLSSVTYTWQQAVQFSNREVFPARPSTARQMYTHLTSCMCTHILHAHVLDITNSFPPTGNCFAATATVVLTEMAVDSQFFTGTLITRGVPDAVSMTGLAADVVNVMSGYTITVSYSDDAPVGVRIATSSVTTSTPGVLSLSASPARAGVPLNVTILDPDLNVDPLVVLTTEVSYVAGPPNCDLYPNNSGCMAMGTLVLTQTSLGSNRFAGLITPFAGTNECFLTCVGVSTAEGAVVTFTYNDAAPFGQRTIAVKIMSTARLDVDLVGVNGSIFATVRDSDMDTDPSIINNCSVSVNKTGFSASTRTLTLFETGVSSGIFTGSLLTSTRLAASVPASVMPNITLRDEVVVTYFDANPGASRVVRRTVLTSSLGTLALTSDKAQISNVVLLERYLSCVWFVRVLCPLLLFCTIFVCLSVCLSSSIPTGSPQSTLQPYCKTCPHHTANPLRAYLCQHIHVYVQHC